MELLIVLGLCFGAYELLGVFQGCFQYNEHQLPYQPHQHYTEKDDNEEQLNEEKRKRAQDDNEITDSKSQKTISDSIREADRLDSIKSTGPCSCISDDVFDDDTRTILRDLRKPLERKRFVLDKPISKFTLSTSLMSLNRDDTNLFNYIDDINSNKFYKFKSDEDDDEERVAVFETAFDKISLSKISNDKRKKKRRNSDTDNQKQQKHNEHSENFSSGNNVDINNKKIFFISTTT